jgi:hypothetical protein
MTKETIDHIYQKIKQIKNSENYKIKLQPISETEIKLKMHNGGIKDGRLPGFRKIEKVININEPIQFEQPL